MTGPRAEIISQVQSTHASHQPGFHFGTLALGLHNHEEAGGLRSTEDGLGVWISAGYAERSAMGAAVVVQASQPGPGPAHARPIILHGWWGPAGGPGAQVPAAARRLCNQNPGQRQHAAAGTGGSNWYLEKFL